jgi:hypothetical protein
MAGRFRSSDILCSILKAISNTQFLYYCGAFGFILWVVYVVQLYGAVGSGVDNQNRIQQFMLSITIPLITTIGMIGLVVNDLMEQLLF